MSPIKLHVVREFTVPGGSVDYVLASVKAGRVLDFVGVELQGLDTTGTVWPERQRFLASCGIQVDSRDSDSSKSFGINWKMNAKTILIQLHHKLKTFECLHKYLVLVIQDHLSEYMCSEFAFGHVGKAVAKDRMHIHAYSLLANRDQGYQLELTGQTSTDSKGIEQCLGLNSDGNVALDDIVHSLESKLSQRTRMKA